MNDPSIRTSSKLSFIFLDDVDGNNMVDMEDKNRTETPPPSYDEALAITLQTSENPAQTPPPPDGATGNLKIIL